MPRSILITGGAGFLGSLLSARLLHDDRFGRVVILSRDWHKHERLKDELGDPAKFRWMLGDVRDRDRLSRAFRGIDCIIHAAAMKSVPHGEYSPREVLLDNCVGTQNVIEAAIDCGVGRVLFISSDKAVHSVNTYGKSKALAESLITSANSYSPHRTIFSIARYANVVGSSDSVVPLFEKQKHTGVLTITHGDMTRLWITPEEAVSFVLQCLDKMQGGEIFIPHLKAARIIDIAHTIAPEASIQVVGVRPGEKLHEVLLAPEEMARTQDLGWAYRVEPVFRFWDAALQYTAGSPVNDYTVFASASALQLTREESVHTITMSDHNIRQGYRP